MNLLIVSSVAIGSTIWLGTTMKNLDFYDYWSVDSANFPEHGGVYAAYSDHDGKLLYIGQTRNISVRWQNHREKERIKEISTKAVVAFCRCDSQQQRQHAEFLLVHAHKPRLNDVNAVSDPGGDGVVVGGTYAWKLVGRYSR